MIHSKFWTNFYLKYIKTSTKEVVIFGIMFGLFLTLVLISKTILVGPLNISLDFLFWILFGFMFTPIKGVVLSVICDLISTAILYGFATWMIEYALIPPLSVLLSYYLNTILKRNSKTTMYISVLLTLILSTLTITFFSFQLINKTFLWENLKKNIIPPEVSLTLIIFFNLCIFTFMFYYLIKFYKYKNDDYIFKMKVFFIISLIIIIFRWLWGPYAFILMYQRFFGGIIKSYEVVLIGIVMKSCITLPLLYAILIPLIKAINIVSKDYFVSYSYK